MPNINLAVIRGLFHHDNGGVRALAVHVHDLYERLDMTDETVADLKTKYEAFRDVVNAKIQALMDAQTGVTLPPTVQQAINDLAAEMTSDTANEAAGANAAVTAPVTGE